MAGVNGIEIKVGQVWRTGDGELVEIKERDPVDTIYPWLGSGNDWYTDRGWYFQHGADTKRDLIELIHDENGFTIWRGGTQPVPSNILVEYRLDDGTVCTDPAGELCWGHEDCPGDIVAYKVVEQSTAQQPADSATLAEETLSALGWTFDGQAWVENAVVEMRIGMVPNALDVQVGGTHYKDCAIQPIEYIHANKLGFAEGNVVKYITRHRQKHGADDVRKVIHYCQLLLELEYGAATKETPNG